MAAHYAYFACFQNLYRVKIKIPSSPSSCKEEVKLELVASDLPYFMALFNHGHILYAVGGVDVFAETAEAGPSYSRKRLIFDFDPSRFPQLPIENSDSLDKPVDFQSMECPRVIRGDDDRIYLLSKNHSCFKPVLEGQFCFQSFDFVKDCFETLPPPPLAPDHALDLDRTLDRFFALGHFVLRGYLYLLISNPLSSKYPKSAFTFNIKSSKWEETSLLAQFEEKEIPPPFGHNGDIGLSDEFSENIRILVALCYTELYAYCVKIHAEGVLEFISYRAIKEIQCVGEDEDGLKCDVTQLADLGGGKFCVVTGSRAIDVLIYVFEINFDLEYRIQSSQSRVGASSGILYYKKFQPGCNIQSFCIVSAPPAIEDQDRVESTTKRERSGDETVHEANDATTMMELEIELKKASDSLKSWDTTSISLTAGCDLFMRYVTRTSALEYEDFNSAKSRLLERAEKFGEISYKARKIIAMLSQDFIFDGCTILVHGFSRVVLEILKTAAQNRKHFRVLCTEGRPDRTGLRLSNELAKLDVPVKLLIDSAVAYSMDEVDMVFVGADGVVESGGIINMMGTYQIALVAKSMNKPVYVAAESYKFARLYPLDQKDMGPALRPIDFGVPIPSKVEVETSARDYTPPQYLSLLFTDLGVLTPSAVSDELIQLYL